MWKCELKYSKEAAQGILKQSKTTTATILLLALILFFDRLIERRMPLYGFCCNFFQFHIWELLPNSTSSENGLSVYQTTAYRVTNGLKRGQRPSETVLSEFRIMK